MYIYVYVCILVDINMYTYVDRRAASLASGARRAADVGAPAEACHFRKGATSRLRKDLRTGSIRETL